jgi:TetR/AcrR family transcriptional regulator, transcriptional repressor for nem operon
METIVGKAEATKQTIIEKAAVIFNRNGYQRTSMSTLCAALGLSKGAIYGNFADKDALAVEAFRYSVQQIADMMRNRIRPHREPVKRLKAYAMAFYELYEDIAGNGGCPVLNTAVDSDDAHPLLHQEVQQVLKNWERSLVAMVDAGKESGDIRGDADAVFFASSFIALIEGGILMAKTIGAKKHLECSVKRIHYLIDQMVINNDLSPGG